MSSNTNHTNNSIINRTNYEEYFILYMDGELNTEETAAVEAFLAANPDLQEEMDILLSTKLDSEDISIDKSFLMADSMKLNSIDESLLLYIDNELNGEEKEEVERKINTNNDYQLQHQLLLKTKLDAADKVVYPNKEELYRHTEKRTIQFSAYWLRIAAAIVILLSISAVLWFSNKPEQAGDSLVVTPNLPAKNNNEENSSVKEENNYIQQEPAQNIIAKTEKEEPASDPAQTNKTVEEKRVYKELAIDPAPAQQIAMVENVIPENRNKLNEEIKTNTIERVTPQQILNKNDVTSLIASTLNLTEASQKETNDDALATNNKSKTVKGFLRKATRFIERTTNINPVNEDDELLIGVVAIKLK